MDAHYCTARCHQDLSNSLPEARFANKADFVNWARLVKSEAEVKLLRDAGRICTHAMNCAIEVMKPGVPTWRRPGRLDYLQQWQRRPDGNGRRLSSNYRMVGAFRGTPCQHRPPDVAFDAYEGRLCRCSG
jgi:Xaa-Pro aminopeptidase